MSELDKKLEAICRTCGGSPGHHKPSMFDPTGVGDLGHIVEGYIRPRQEDVHVHVCSCGQMATTRFMTGEEWYKKFEKELVGKPFYITGPGDVYVIHAVQQCLRIAQRVSGVPIEPADFDWSERQKKRFKENKEKLSDWALPAIRPEVWWDEY